MIAVRIAGIGTAVPEYVVDQSMVRETVARVFGESVAGLDKLLQVFEHEHIVTRRFVRPTSWYGEDHGFAATNEVFAETAVGLGTQAAKKALVGREADVRAIVVASTTGIMTPSVDAALTMSLGLSPHVTRIPIFGLGCAAGVSGLARAAELSRLYGGAPVLFVAVEICSVTFQRSDSSKSNIVGSSIFGDGAAAVLVSADGTGPEIQHGYSTLFPHTEDIMGWDVTDTGLRVRFSRDIPAFVRAHIPGVLVNAYQAWGISAADVGDIIAHPGGAKVLTAYSEATGKPLADFQHAFDILREFGNMSSASVLFVLERWLNDGKPKPRYSIMSALGPGFSAEQLLLS